MKLTKHKRPKINKPKSKTKRFMQNAGKLTAKQRREIQESQQKKEQFRKMFINALNSNNIITQLTNGIKSNRTSINTLIPINDDFKPVTKEMGQQIVNFVPLLAILIHNINDTQGIKQIVDIFVKNTGNINLKSTRQSITALSMAVEHRNGELVEALINSGADINTLDIKQISDFNELMRNRQLELNASPINKLDLTIEVPMQGYDLSVEPEFWKPIFVKDELTNIKNRLKEMMNNDRQIPFVNYELDHIYSVCEIVKIIIPSFYVPSKNAPVYTENMITQELNLDFSNYNIILCASMLLYGIISKKMEGQDYLPLFKGGKAVQLIVPEVYESEDIDLVITPAEGIIYDVNMVKRISGHIACLIQWFFNNEGENMLVSVQTPDTNANTNVNAKKTNQYIYKLAYVKSSQGSSKYKQFSDIDFREIPENVKRLFGRFVEYTFDIPELEEKVLFRCPNAGGLLDEKIYYAKKYYILKNLLVQGKPITDPEYKDVTIEEAERIHEKFRRAIIALIRGLYKRRFPELSAEELEEKSNQALKKRVDKF